MSEANYMYGMYDVWVYVYNRWQRLVGKFQPETPWLDAMVHKITYSVHYTMHYTMQHNLNK